MARLTEARIRAWDLSVVAGTTRAVTATFPVDSDLSAGVSLWLDATITGGVMVGGTEIVGAVVANVATLTVPAPAENVSVNWSVGGVPITTGTLYRSSDGSTVVPTSTTLEILGGAEVVFSVIGSVGGSIDGGSAFSNGSGLYTLDGGNAFSNGS